MDKIIQALADTSIPTIVTVSGVALLFLALVGKFGTYVEIPAKRQNLAAGFGAALLLVGVSLHLLPILSGGSEGDRAEGPSSPTSNNGSIRWIMAGSYSIRESAVGRQQDLLDKGINAITVESDEYDFLCPGFFAVIVLSPNLAHLQAELPKVRAVVPDAYPRNPATFNRDAC
ncbi:MAG: hypothetical protein AAF718_11205 [Pseudomonadota bacterium]